MSRKPDPTRASQGQGLRLVGIAEKGYALRPLDNEPLLASLGGVACEMFETIAQEMSAFRRVALSPVRAKPEDLPRFQGTNERISTTNLMELVHFYHQLIRNASQTAPSP